LIAEWWVVFLWGGVSSYNTDNKMTWWKITIGLILTWIIYLKTKKYFNHRQAIGKSVTIEYADQNIYFESIFPKTGTITQFIKVGNQNMFVLDLDTSFGYERGNYKKIVIAERHAGRYIGAKEEIEVHVLLPKIKLTKDKYLFEEFDHVVWATIKPKE
jgi:hypothetical protein